MADVSITIRVQGTPEVLAAFKGIQSAAVQTGEAASQASTSARTSADQATRAVGGFRQQAMALSSALAGAAAVASIFARNNAALQRQLEVLSLTMSGLSTSVRAVGAGMRVVISIIGVKIAIVGAAIAAVVLLIRYWDQAVTMGKRLWANFAQWFMRLWDGLKDVLIGVGKIALGVMLGPLGFGVIQQGLRQMQQGISRIAPIIGEAFKQAGALAVRGWEGLQKLFGMTATAAQGAAKGIKDTADALKGLPIEAQQAWINMANRWEAAAKSLYGSLSTVRQGLGQVEEQVTKMGRSFDAFRTHWDDLNEVATLFGPLVEGIAVTLQVPLADAMEIVTNLQVRAAQSGSSFAEVLREVGTRAREAGLSVVEYLRSLQPVTVTLREQVDIARALVELEEERTRQGLSTVEALRAAKDQLIASLEAYALIATGVERIRIEIELLRLRMGQVDEVLDPLKQKFGEWADVIKGALEAARWGFEQFSVDFLSGTRSFGEALADLWRNIANAIIQELARIAASWVFQQLLGGLGGMFGVDFTKYFEKRQRGGELIVTRPTLMAVGEAGAERVTVQPVAGSMQRRAAEPVRWEGPTILMPITINAVDAQSFLGMAQRSGRGLAEIMLGEMRKNSTLGKLLGGASVP